jgi:hypothetical protein
MGEATAAEPEERPGDRAAEATIPAGAFGSWLRNVRAAIREDADSDVPCDGCTACCRSLQFIHIAPTETDALANIPRELLFPAPGRPAGHVLMGYDDQGACPMLVDDACSIYRHRPTTCRTYDCRVLAATGLGLGSDGGDVQPLIAVRARRWRFDAPAADDRASQDAVRAAARFVTEQRVALTVGLEAGGEHPAIPTNPMQVAVLAVDIADVFLGPDDDDASAAVADPGLEAVRVAISGRRRAAGER